MKELLEPLLSFLGGAFFFPLMEMMIRKRLLKLAPAGEGDYLCPLFLPFLKENVMEAVMLML